MRGLFFVIRRFGKPRVINTFSFWTTFCVDKKCKVLKMCNMTKSFGKLCKIFYKNNCQNICTIEIIVVLLHRIFGSCEDLFSRELRKYAA